MKGGHPIGMPLCANNFVLRRVPNQRPAGLGERSKASNGVGAAAFLF